MAKVIATLVDKNDFEHLKSRVTALESQIASHGRVRRCKVQLTGQEGHKEGFFHGWGTVEVNTNAEHGELIGVTRGIVEMAEGGKVFLVQPEKIWFDEAPSEMA